jgi:Tol biopolymer transport system component
MWLALAGTLPLLAVGSGAIATANPTVPPRNGLIAVYGGDGLYLVDPAAGSAARVPRTEEAGDAAWSPDGTRLAVTLWGADDETSDVFTMKPDGSDRALVIRDASSPTWSPDGKWLAVVREHYSEEGSGLGVVSVDGEEERVLLPRAGAPPVPISAPAWSPDGKLIAFVGDGARVELVTPDGERQGGFDAEANGTSLSWSPDSSRLAFDRFLETKADVRHVVVVLDLATGKETLLRGEQLGAQEPAWSPEGDQIAFISMRLKATQPPTTTGHSCGGEPYDISLWAMRPDGAKAHQLAEGDFYGRVSWGRAVESSVPPAPAADQEPAPVAEPQPAPAADVPPASQKPEPAKPAATSRPARAPLAKNEVPAATKGLIAVRGSNAIYLVDPDSAEAHKVSRTADMIAPAWSPDGSLLAVERVEKAGGSNIYTIGPDGSQPQLVAENASAPSWSPDGGRIFVVRNECSAACEAEDEDANVLYSVRPDGSDLRRVDLEEADFDDPRELAWRIDGTPIGFFDDESVSGPGSFDTAEAAWSPDETRIAFIGALSPTDEEASADTVTAGLWIVSADGGTPQLLLEGASGWPSWSPTK